MSGIFIYYHLYAYFHLDFQGVKRFPHMFFVDIDTLKKRVTNSINGLYYVVTVSKAKQIQFKDKQTIYQYSTNFEIKLRLKKDIL